MATVREKLAVRMGSLNHVTGKRYELDRRRGGGAKIVCGSEGLSPRLPLDRLVWWLDGYLDGHIDGCEVGKRIAGSRRRVS